MLVLSYDVSGMGRSPKKRVFRHLIKTKKLEVILFQETMLATQKAMDFVSSFLEGWNFVE